MLSVANFAIIMKISNISNIVYRQMPVPWDLPQQIPAPQAEAWMQKPQGGGKCLVQIPGGAQGVVMNEIDTCIIEKCVFPIKSPFYPTLLR